MKINLDGWTKIGEISVDSGLIWIGDPCYVIHNDKYNKELGNNWIDFCNNFFDKKKKSSSYVNFEGLGIAIQTPLGDGQYSVYAQYNQQKQIIATMCILE